MHILVTNDDGPPSPESSPYVLCLVRQLQRAGHVVSVCLPHTQRSWIGKAHMIGQTLKPLYYRPATAAEHGAGSEGTTHRRPSAAASASASGPASASASASASAAAGPESEPVEEWILLDGTPASCVQIGLHHFFQDRGAIDVVVSGPNYGRNTSSVFALSSGTLGAALEAAVCRRRAIALSFAFFSRNHDPVVIEAACRHSVRIIEALCRQWPADGSADLYSVNVPLVEDVERNRTLWADMLQNYWGGGSCFQEVDADDDADAAEQELLIREGPGGEAFGDGAGGIDADDGRGDGGDKSNVTSDGGGDRPVGHIHKHFKWAPRLADVYKSVAESGPGNDGRTVKEGNTSITPLKASFAQGKDAFSRKEFEFADPGPEAAGVTASSAPPPPLRAFVAYDDAYVQPLIVSALRRFFPDGALELVTEPPPPAGPETEAEATRKTVQVTSYEAIDFAHAAARGGSWLVNSYMIRKALVRKHFLGATVEHWAAKRPASALATHFRRGEAFDVDYAEFLDDALVEAFDLRASLGRNEAARRAAGGAGGVDAEWWILKPGMSDRGQGIRLFGSMDELQAIFDGWDRERPDSDDDDGGGDEDEDEGDDDDDGNDKHLGRTSSGIKGEAGDYVTTSHLRHFVAQPYIHPPLLLESDPRKFHIRAYVLSAGSLAVYVYRPMLALFAAEAYLPPWAPGGADAGRFLTNTCLRPQQQRRGSGSGPSSAAADDDDDGRVRRFWDLPLPAAQLADIFDQVCRVTGDVFEAAATAMPVHFQPLPHAFEVFGLDFLVDAAGVAFLLEANAFPDFRQTGRALRGVVEGFWVAVVREAVVPFFGGGEAAGAGGGGGGGGDMVLVKRLDLGRR